MKLCEFWTWPEEPLRFPLASWDPRMTCGRKKKRMTCEQTGEPPRGLDTMRNTDTYAEQCHHLHHLGCARSWLHTDEWHHLVWSGHVQRMRSNHSSVSIFDKAVHLTQNRIEDWYDLVPCYTANLCYSTDYSCSFTVLIGFIDYSSDRPDNKAYTVAIPPPTSPSRPFSTLIW